MLSLWLTYGNEGFKEIKEFLNQNYHKDYTLSIYNNLEQSAMEVICDFDSMMDVIFYVVNVEHDFPAKKKCLSPAKKYKLYKSSINKSIHFVQRNLSSSTKKVPGELVNWLPVCQSKSLFLKFLARLNSGI